MVDSTFATPVLQRPLSLGADFVLHSMTKYLGGHGDALGGIVAGAQEDIDKIREGALIHLGGAMSPFNAWLINRGLATLSLRMQKQGGVWRFTQGVKGPSGERITLQRKGQRPPAPKLRIANADGSYERVLSFEYG